MAAKPLFLALIEQPDCDCDQIKYYTTDPTAENIQPGNLTKPAIAIKSGGNGGPIFIWSIVTHSWA